jgi:hypothetical protein
MISASGFPRIKTFDVKIQSNPEAKEKGFSFRISQDLNF